MAPSKHRRRRGASRRRRFPVTALVLLLLGAIEPVWGEIVLLADGGWLKVRHYRLEEDGRLRVELPGGGAMVLPIGRVERIVDDEVAPKGETEPVPPPPVFATSFDPSHEPPNVPYGEEIFAAAERHGLNPTLVAAVVRAESAFRADAVSHKGAQGLMQLMPATARRFGVDPRDVFQPSRNLDAGSRYLRLLLDRFDGDLARTLAGYNAGEGTVDRYGGVPPYRETRDYIARIFRTLGLDESGAVVSATTGTTR